MAIRITFNGSNIDLNVGPGGLQRPYKMEGNQSRSASGKIETIGLYNFGEQIIFDASFQEAVYRQLIAWWAWAEQGNAFSFALDSAEVGNTTLDAAAAAAQKVIPLTATAAFAAGDVCLIRSADRSKYEIVVIDTISAGVSVTAVANLYYTYASGDIFRHLEYYPSLLVPIGEVFDPVKEGSWWSYKFKFLEAL